MTTTANEGYFPKEYNDEFQREFIEYKQGKRWIELISFLEKVSEEYPKEYFLYTELSSAYYVLEDKERCLYNAFKAFEIEPKDPLVIYNYAMALSLNGEHQKSLDYFSKVYKKTVNEIAFCEYGEGIKWAKSLKNDSCYMIGSTFAELGNYKKAAYYISMHIRKRRRGQYSDFSKAQVVRKLNSVLFISSAYLHCNR